MSLLGPPSIRSFYDDNAGRFKLKADDPSAATEPRKNRNGSDAAGRLTTTATCIEALSDYGPRLDASMHEWTGNLLSGFSIGALNNDRKNWTSEGAAWVYCRVRTLGSILRLRRDVAPLNNRARQRVNEAWDSHGTNAGAYGLREATDSNPDKWRGEPTDLHYPENAYLTYWGILAKESLYPESSRGSIPPEAKAWLISSAAAQVAYRYNKSPLSDPQQLLWCLAGIVRTLPDKIARATSPEHEILKAGLRAFFDSQNERGEWDRGAALFHYPQAGNAYCYIYETLGEFISLSLLRNSPAAETLRNLLRPYFQQLMHAFNSLEAMQQRLTQREKLVGWSSGHHPHRLAPESWATASVFRFLEMLRRLVGWWANKEAQRALHARRARSNLETLAERGGTWDVGTGQVGLQFSTMFVQPVLMKAARQKDDLYIADPDVRVLDKKQAHSALLFGPPGTGKTTLVEAIAGAIGWDFIEITPAQFLSEGVEMVSARADIIFKAAMELDHCVILLDEIDQLIQTRDAASDPIERFFTTTMLPRLANLWNEAKVLFFVNTNAIQKVDPAIRRSQRFDAVVMVMPPGFVSKAKELNKYNIGLEVSEPQVTDLLNGKPGNTSSIVGWFGLLRHDQIEALASKLARPGEPTTVDAQRLAEGLRPFAISLASLDWEADKNTSYTDPEKLPHLLDHTTYQRRDPRVERFVRVEGPVPSDLQVGLVDECYVAVDPTEEKVEAWADKIGAVVQLDGKVEF